MVWFIALVLELLLPVEPTFLADQLDKKWRCQGEVAGFHRDAPQRVLREDQNVVTVEVEARKVGGRLYTHGVFWLTSLPDKSGAANSEAETPLQSMIGGSS